MKPVLFVISMKNYQVYHGFRLTDSKYSALPDEQEVLLMEGFEVYCLKVEEIVIKTSNWVYRELNERVLTIIHLHHDGEPIKSS